MDQLVLIFSVAIIVEALLEYTKSVVYMFTRGCVKCGVIRICAAVIGVGLALLTGVNLFAEFNIPISQPWIGSALTGIIISRGSNYLNDIISRLANPTSAISSKNDKSANTSTSNQNQTSDVSPASSGVDTVQPAAAPANNPTDSSQQWSAPTSSAKETSLQPSNQAAPLGPDDFPEAIEDNENSYHQAAIQTDSQTDVLGISGID